MNMLSDEMTMLTISGAIGFASDDVGAAHAKGVTQSCPAQLATKGGER